MPCSPILELQKWFLTPRTEGLGRYVREKLRGSALVVHSGFVGEGLSRLLRHKLEGRESIRQDGRVITTLAFVLEFPLASLTSLSLALLPFTTMAVSLSTGARIRLKLVNEPTSGNRSVSVISFEEAAELDAALSKSRDSQSSIFFSPENVGLGEGFPSLADLLNASAVQSSAADGLVVADGLLLAIESTLTARVDGLLGDPSMLSPIITSNYIQESHLPDVVSGPGDLLAPSCFNGRSRGLQRDIRAKKKGLQPQGVASVPDNRSSSSNSVLGRKARKPKAMIYTCSLPEVDVEKRALMQGKENRHLAEALGGEGVSLLVYPRLIGNGKPGECYQLPLLPLAPTTLSVEGYPVDLRKGVASLRSPPFRSPQLLNPILNVQLGIHKFTSLSSSNKIVMLVVAVPFPRASSSLNLKEEGVFANSVAMILRRRGKGARSKKERKAHHIGQRHQQLKKLTAEFKQKMGEPEKKRLALGRAHTHEPTLIRIQAPVDSETAIMVNGSKAREREVSDAKGNSSTKASVVITLKKPKGKKEEQKQRRCLPHRPLTIYPWRLSLRQRDSLFLEQARRYQDKILAEAEKEEEKEERTATITSLDELQLCPFVNEGIEKPAKGSTAEFQDYETKSWD
ncbi:hypothetical protein Tco_0735118 [Tanacetum coccineum]